MSTIEFIDRMYEQKQKNNRLRLGCSEIGKKCDRSLWYSFRKVKNVTFNGRMLRLFEVGQRHEDVFINDLRMAGVDIVDRDDDGNQFSVDFGYHISGSLDGIIRGGLQEYHDKIMIAEFKTHNEKSFEYLEKNGLKKAKTQHYTQMQLYMHGTRIEYGYYLAECKNDCRRWSDIIKYDERFAEKQLERAKSITMADSPPERLSLDDEIFDCKYCDYQDICRGRELPEINCRTCVNSTPCKDSTFKCEFHGSIIPNEHQLDEQRCHVIHPDLINIKCVSGDRSALTFLVCGIEIANGINGRSSRELLELIGE